MISFGFSPLFTSNYVPLLFQIHVNTKKSLTNLQTEAKEQGLAHTLYYFSVLLLVSQAKCVS